MSAKATELSSKRPTTTRSMKVKDKADLILPNLQQLDSDSEDVHTALSHTDRHPSNNSAIRLQQQGTGDHHLSSSSKQHKSKSRISRKYHRPTELCDVDPSLSTARVYRWRLTAHVLILFVLSFIIYRCILAAWPRPQKTWLIQLIDGLSTFLTL